MIQFIHLGAPTSLPPLVAIPGIDGTIGSVQSIAARLAEKREVIVVDYGTETNTTLEDLSAEIAALVKTEGLAMMDMLGQSIGTVITAQIASDYDLPVRKVVLCCTFTHLNWTVLRLVVAFLRITPRWLYLLTLRLSIFLMCGPVGDGRNNPAFTTPRVTNATAIARRTAWEIDRDFATDLVKITQPLLILMGEQDRFVPNVRQEVQKLRDMFANQPARIETIPDAGHIFLPSAAIALASEKIATFLE